MALNLKGEEFKIMNRWGIIAILITFIIISNLSVFAEEQIEKSTEYRKSVQIFYERLQNNKNALFNANLAEYYKQVFDPEIIQINFRTLKRKNGNQTQLNFGTVWFSKGALYIRQQAKGSDNYITVDNGIYSWQAEADRGVMYTRKRDDTMNFLIYFIDISGIMRSFYYKYLQSIDSFDVNKQNNLFEIKLKKTYSQKDPYIFSGIGFYEKPLWLREVYIRSNNSTSEGYETITQFDNPIVIYKIPLDIMELPEAIKFEKVNETIESKMVYL